MQNWLREVLYPLIAAGHSHWRRHHVPHFSIRAHLQRFDNFGRRKDDAPADRHLPAQVSAEQPPELAEGAGPNSNVHALVPSSRLTRDVAFMTIDAEHGDSFAPAQVEICSQIDRALLKTIALSILLFSAITVTVPRTITLIAKVPWA